jgi:hypothetical protein
VPTEQCIPQCPVPGPVPAPPVTPSHLCSLLRCHTTAPDAVTATLTVAPCQCSCCLQLSAWQLMLSPLGGQARLSSYWVHKHLIPCWVESWPAGGGWHLNQLPQARHTSTPTLALLPHPSCGPRLLYVKHSRGSTCQCVATGLSWPPSQATQPPSQELCRCSYEPRTLHLPYPPPGTTAATKPLQPEPVLGCLVLSQGSGQLCLL